jgi:ribosomal protein S18 acetylase RimI-like enzyme
VIELRAAEPRDDPIVAELMYATAAGRYDLFAGDRDRDRALRLLAATIATPGNDTSREGVVVAELHGAVAGVLAAFPVAEGTARRRRFVRRVLRRRAPWHWPRLLRLARLGERLEPDPPADALYIDALATAEAFRRRGVATALLAAADERARSLGLARLALDTTAANAPARALYEGAGFRLTAELPAGPVIPAVVFYERDVA